MSASQLLLLPLELRTQILSYLMTEDLFSPRTTTTATSLFYKRNPPPLLHVNRQIRAEYLDILSHDKTLTFYTFYPETAMWDVTHDMREKMGIFLGSGFRDLFHLNSLASAQRFVEHERSGSCLMSSKGRKCGILALGGEGGSQVQRFWMWDGRRE